MKTENKYVNKAIIKILLRNVHFMYFFLIHRKFLLVKQESLGTHIYRKFLWTTKLVHNLFMIFFLNVWAYQLLTYPHVQKNKNHMPRKWSEILLIIKFSIETLVIFMQITACYLLYSVIAFNKCLLNQCLCTNHCVFILEIILLCTFYFYTLITKSY